MKIITWNCRMKFREEYNLIFPMNPDIVVVPECEDIKKINFDMFSKPPTDFYWIGNNEHKGLGVFTFNDITIDLDLNYNDTYEYILPLILKRKKERYHLLGVWTQEVKGERKKNPPFNEKVLDEKGKIIPINYIRQFRLSMIHYSEFLENENVIICGDFNSNLLWKKPHGIVTDRDHEYVVEQLRVKKIYSSYHHYFKEEQGKETLPTFYYHHKKEKPFHLDFCFLSKNLLDKITSVEIGKYEDWRKYSDHVPMIINMD